MRSNTIGSVVLALLILVALAAAPGISRAFEIIEVLYWGDSGDFTYPASVHPGQGDTAFVSDFSTHVVRRFSSDHTLVDTSGTQNVAGSTDDLFAAPNGIDLARRGGLYVADSGNDRIKLIHPAGSFDDETKGGEGLTIPKDVAFDNRDRLYVADSGNNRVMVLDVNTWVKIDEWGSYGSTIGKFNNPTGIAVDHNRMVYVADYGNDRVQKFDADGTWKATWIGGSNGGSVFSDPFRVGVNPRGDVYVAETGSDRIQVLTSSGEFIRYLGAGTLADPGDATPGIYRDVYVVDSGHDRIAEYSGTEPSSTAQEIAGVDRYATAVALSQSEYEDGGSDVVVLATGQHFADALSASPLAGQYGAPILLTRTASLPDIVATEIQRLGASHVFIVGGTGAVSEAVETAAAAVPGVAKTTRLSGPTRYDAPFEIAAYLTSWHMPEQSLRGHDPGRPIFIATGRNFPDALAIAPFAAAMSSPIYLSNGDLGLTGKVQYPWFGVSEVIVVGGTGVVPDIVEDQFNDAMSWPDGAVNYRRIAGPNRYETAAKLAKFMVDNYGFDWGHTAFATGMNYPDALAGGPIQGYENSPLLLTRTTSLPPETKTKVEEYAKGFYDIRYLGGIGAVSSAVRTEIEAELY